MGERGRRGEGGRNLSFFAEPKTFFLVFWSRVVQGWEKETRKSWTLAHVWLWNKTKQTDVVMQMVILMRFTYSSNAALFLLPYLKFGMARNATQLIQLFDCTLWSYSNCQNLLPTNWPLIWELTHCGLCACKTNLKVWHHLADDPSCPPAWNSQWVKQANSSKTIFVSPSL